MADLVKTLVTGVIDTVLREILKKATGTSKRRKRQARTASGRFKRVKAAAKAARKPARKQVSRRRTAAARSKAWRS
ncbi:hypothetical protein [Rhizobium sp. CC-YZS058]|uniref:hypothetical protein n=1 Tax=Rhizobium sp. CC-YZS058 TaxID=3042153 RepID=UPI002B05FFAF|nr:hypothetical protein [Rhizobium sp. CC-YZS058]MEA3534958.1 hypothetical protein [Rhizobium sp. CC-YZS058]